MMGYQEEPLLEFLHYFLHLNLKSFVVLLLDYLHTVKVDGFSVGDILELDQLTSLDLLSINIAITINIAATVTGTFFKYL